MHAQKIVKVKGQTRTFEYQGVVYKYKDMGQIFVQDEVSNNYFIKSSKQIKTAKAFGYTSLASAAIGGIALALNEGCSGFLCFSTEEIIAGVSIGLVFPITGLIGIIINSSGSRNLRNAVDSYNSRELGRIQPAPRVEIGVVKGGLGMWITF